MKALELLKADSLQEAIDMAEDVESGQMEAIDDTLCFEFDEEFIKKTNKKKGNKMYITVSEKLAEIIGVSNPIEVHDISDIGYETKE